MRVLGLLPVFFASLSFGSSFEAYCGLLLQMGELTNAHLAQIVQIHERSKTVGDAISRGHREAPDQALRRGRFIAGELEAAKEIVEFVGVDSQGNAQSKGNKFPDVRVVEIPGVNTTRSHYRDGEIPDDVEVMVLAIHGMTMSYSHMGSMYPFLDLLGRVRTGDVGSGGHFATFLRPELERLKLSPKVGVQLVDLIGHGTGPQASAFPELTQVRAYLKAIVVDLRKRLDAKGKKHVPIVVLSRSGAPMFVADLSLSEPGLIDGAVDVSATLPDIGFADGFAGVLAELALPGADARLNFPALEWFLGVRRQVKYTSRARPYRVPHLVVTGGRDLQTPNVVREWLRRSVEGSAGSEYHDYEGMEHDVYRLPSAYEAIVVSRSREVRPRAMGQPRSYREWDNYAADPHVLAAIRRSLPIYEDLFRFLHSVPKR